MFFIFNPILWLFSVEPHFNISWFCLSVPLYDSKFGATVVFCFKSILYNLTFKIAPSGGNTE